MADGGGWRGLIAEAEPVGLSLAGADLAGPSPLEGPAEVEALRALGHRMVDDALDGYAAMSDGAAAGPVWRPMPDALRASFRSDPLPRAGGGSAEAAYADYRARVAPHAVGNRHPRFLGWVHGGGTALGALADLAAAGLNANLGGRDHAPVEVEREVVRWSAEVLGMPPGASGLLTSGASMANLVGVLVARERALGPWGVRAGGVAAAVAASGRGRLVAYASEAAHLCVGRALDLAGLGSDALRLVPADAAGRVRVDRLSGMLEADRAAGLRPFLVVGTAGAVDTGAVDDLGALADLCAREGDLWFHVDAAIGGAAVLSPALRDLFGGIGRADSVAFDWHKLAGVPYEAGCVVVRDAAAHRAAFARDPGGSASYLRSGAAEGGGDAGGRSRGLAGSAGEPWPVDLGPELSRGFRALKVWLSLKAYGADRIGAAAERCCALARRLGEAVAAEPALEPLAPVALNVVVFRHRALGDAGQEALAAGLQEAGGPVLSTTRVPTWDGGERGPARVALRACFANHRAGAADADAVVPAVLAAAASMTTAGRAGGGAA